MIIQDSELVNVIGGASSISGTLINSVVKLVTFLFDLGKSLGSSIRYKTSGIVCK